MGSNSDQNEKPSSAADEQDPSRRPRPAADNYSQGQGPVVPLWQNLITIIGIFLVFMSILLLLTFGLFSLVTPTANPYVDIAGYLLLPGILILGLIITPLGILFKSWRLHRRDPKQRLAFRFPRIDLNDPAQRRAAKIIIAVTFLLLPVVGVTGYHGYHFTDSVQFCARSCHSVMEPQSTTYEHSAHARVPCAECHIGAGASWFVKSKLSGTRLVFVTWRKSYPRPIPPAISNLRPARETCERCHWPKKFYGAQLASIVHYAADENNSRREIDMLLKIGGGDESSGRAEGIHMHMALAGRVEYIATDDRLQEIPWVKWIDRAGKERIYRSDGRPSSDPKPQGQLRQLDCMDCHNRPAHKFRSPVQAVDVYLEIGNIDTTLPYIKREAVAALVLPYPDVETANTQIGAYLIDFYRTSYPEVWRTRKASINQAVDRVREIYQNNFFPEMNVDWQTYPDNIGHKTSPGCFRCHEGRHVNQLGEKISHDCNICHTFLNRVGLEGETPMIEEGEFIHPLKPIGQHETLQCYQCHTGGTALDPTCQGCHSAQQGLYTAAADVWEDFNIEPDPMVGHVDCESCHDLSQPFSLEAVDLQCMDCHEDEEEEYEGMLSRWAEDVAKKRRKTEGQISILMSWINAHHEEGIDESVIAWVRLSREKLQLLANAGPLHNHTAAMRICETLTSEAAACLARLKVN